MDRFNKIGVKKVSDIVYEKLMEKISSSKWPAGYRLPSENELARSFAVSRNSVRSAIQRLNALGILESRNGDGTFVQNFSAQIVVKAFVTLLALKPAQAIDLLELRKGVESISCELAAKRGTPEELKILRGYVEQMKAAAKRGDYKTYAENDLKFHFCIAEMSKNPAVVSVMEILRDTIFAHFIEFAQHFILVDSAKVHERICKAIERGDSAAAVRLSQKNIEANIVEIRGGTDMFQVR
jgi:GntR family transcriptional repressor for pyruvate dehydrogenase complex